MGKSYLLRYLLFLGSVALQFPVFVFSQKITATGTGNTTGHIANITVSNTGKTPLSVKLGPYLIPAAKKHQGYAISGIYTVNVQPKESITIPVAGYCTHPGLPAAGAGEQLPDFDAWVNADHVPAISPGVTLLRKDGFIPTETPGGVTYPGTDIPFLYTINIDKYPDAAARLVIDLVRAITDSYDDLYNSGVIHTPFSGDRQREEEAIKQQVIWYVLGILTGKPYDRDDFRDNLIRQLENQLLTPFEEAPPAVREELENGIDEFWTTITLVGVEAKVLQTTSKPEQSDKDQHCRLICPPSNSIVDGFDLHFEWQCETPATGPFELQLKSENSQPIVIQGLTGTSHNLLQQLPQGTNYEAVLRYPTSGGMGEAVPVSFTTEEDCIRELQDIMRRLDTLWSKVQNARDELEGNALVQQARNIQMLKELFTNPQSVLDMFDQWLADQFPFPDLSAVENPDDMVDYVNANADNIRQTLEYAKKIMQFVGARSGVRTHAIIAKIDATLKAMERKDDFTTVYNHLRSAISDIRGYIGAQLKEYTQKKIRSKIEELLVRQFGKKAAGTMMSAATDAWNYFDALIKEGNLDEAKKLYHLMYFDMLNKAHECQRYRIDETWNSPTNGLPRIEWADCRAVLNKTVTLTAVVKCWVGKPNGQPNEGRFEERRINFAGGAAQLVRQEFKSDCEHICAFQFQLDLADLAAKAKGCEHVYVEVQASIDGNPAQSIFVGVYRP